MLDSLFQEIDIDTGELIFEWRASQHFAINSTFSSLGGGGHDRASAFDFFHINSIDKDENGNYIISSRHSHTVACVSQYTGETIWVLGGKVNEFRDLSDGKATDFSWQHDARWHASNRTLTVFDNASNSHADPNADSRGMVIYLDIPRREATLLAAYYHPYHIHTASQGNVQILDETGRAFVAWGHSAAYSEYTADGQLECNAHFGASAYFGFGRVVSYRVLKGEWTGHPQTQPDAVVIEDTVFASWNGATEVSAWRLETWDFRSNEPSAGALDIKDTIPIGQYAKIGFETEIPIPPELQHPFFRLAALDEDGNVLGATDPLQRAEQSSPDTPGTIYWLVGAAFLAGLCGLLAAFPRVWRSCRCQRRLDRVRSSYQLLPLEEHVEGQSR